MRCRNHWRHKSALKWLYKVQQKVFPLQIDSELEGLMSSFKRKVTILRGAGMMNAMEGKVIYMLINMCKKKRKKK